MGNEIDQLRCPEPELEAPARQAAAMGRGRQQARWRWRWWLASMTWCGRWRRWATATVLRQLQQLLGLGT
jgi:hypothetical protein